MATKKGCGGAKVYAFHSLPKEQDKLNGVPEDVALQEVAAGDAGCVGVGIHVWMRSVVPQNRSLRREESLQYRSEVSKSA